LFQCAGDRVAAVAVAVPQHVQADACRAYLRQFGHHLALLAVIRDAHAATAGGPAPREIDLVDIRSVFRHDIREAVRVGQLVAHR
jgi:hypothetical protein